jgi:hypothetical protein
VRNGGGNPAIHICPQLHLTMLCFALRRFGIIDIFEASDIMELHADNVHMSTLFYKEIARLVFGHANGE